MNDAPVMGHVISPGWSIQHSFGHPWDYQAGKQYRLFIRAKATATEPDNGIAISCGIHVRQGSRTCGRNIKLGEVDGRWQVFDIGPWNPTEDGGILYIARGRSGAEEVFLDCLWLVETMQHADVFDFRNNVVYNWNGNNGSVLGNSR